MTTETYQDIGLVLINFNSRLLLQELFCFLDDLVGKIDIFVIDDNSTDGSEKELREKYGEHILLHINEKNSGPAFCRNYALKNIAKPYLLFYDPDIKIDAQSLFSLMDRRKSGDIVFPQIRYFNGNLMTPVNEFEKTRCANSAIFIIDRKKVESCAQYFDEDMFIYVEDIDIFSRWWAFGFKFQYCEDIIAFHPEKKSYTEKLYFFRVRNPLILFIKQAGLIRLRFNPVVWISTYTVLNFMAALINRDLSVANKGFGKAKLSDGKGFWVGRMRLLSVFFKALFWNIQYLENSMYKRARLKSDLLNSSLRIKDV